MGPGSAFGPYWDLYPKAFEGCRTKWWPNLFFIQNLYPGNFDEKCMGWSWFIACYVQLSLTLPILLLIHRALPKIVSTLIYFGMLIGITTVNFLFVKNSGTGIFLTFDNGVYLNFDFLSQLFMKPYFHFGVYLWGVMLCLAYLTFVKDQAYGNSQSTAFSTGLLQAIKNNGLYRYPLYVIWFGVMTLIVFGLHPYLKDNGAWSPTMQAAYAALGYPGYVLGASFFLLCALLGRAEFVRFFFGGEVWTLFRSMAYGLALFVPVQALNYFLSMSNSQHLDYQMMFYNFCGIFIFSMIFVNIFFVFVDRPFHALFNMRHDLRMITASLNLYPETFFNIEHYKVGYTAKEGRQAPQVQFSP